MHTYAASPPLVTLPKSVAVHSAADLTYADCDETTGIVHFTAASHHRPGHLNTVSLDTTTGAIHCDCKGAQCDQACWHADHVAAAWLASPAMQDVRWLTVARLVRYGTTAAAMVNTYRARIGRVLPMDAANLIAARSEWRRRAALATPVADADLPLAA